MVIRYAISSVNHIFLLISSRLAQTEPSFLAVSAAPRIHGRRWGLGGALKNFLGNLRPLLAS